MRPAGSGSRAARYALRSRGSLWLARAGVFSVLLLLLIPAMPTGSAAAPASHPSRSNSIPDVRPDAQPNLTANWSVLNEPTSPSPRAEATFTWATLGGKQMGVLFGGRGNFSALDNDTWLFENGVWHELHLSVAPVARRGAMAAYDPADGYVVLFGGSTGTAFLNDTWVFNGSAWTELFPPVSPAARRVGGLAWDPVDGYLLLFSGHNGTSLGSNANFTTIQDTWTFVHGRWTQLHPALQPLGRSEPSEIWDPALGGIVVFGGYTTQPSYLAYNDTWMFLGGVWTQIVRSVAPSPRDGAPMAFDVALGVPVLEGGQNESGNISTLELNDTWVLNGTSAATLAWQPVNTDRAPLPADSASMVYDPELETVLVFGGHSGDHAVTWYNTTSALELSFSVRIVANQSAATPLSFDFSETTSGGVGPYSYSWYFGTKGGTSTEANPQYSYLKKGNDNVTLNATDSVGNLATATLNVNAYHRLRATLNESAATVSAGSPVTLNVSTTGGFGAMRYAWSGLPAGCLSSNVSTLVCSPTALGPFVIGVNVTDSRNGSATSEQNLTVQSGGSTPGSTPTGKTSKFPAWVFAAGAVVVLAVVLAVVLWRREKAQAAARSKAPRKTPPGGT